MTSRYDDVRGIIPNANEIKLHLRVHCKINVLLFNKNAQSPTGSLIATKVRFVDASINSIKNRSLSAYVTDKSKHF